MNVIEGAVPGVKILEPRTFGDPGDSFGKPGRANAMKRRGFLAPSCRTICRPLQPACFADCIFKSPPPLKENWSLSPGERFSISRWTCGWVLRLSGNPLSPNSREKMESNCGFLWVLRTDLFRCKTTPW